MPRIPSMLLLAGALAAALFAQQPAQQQSTSSVTGIVTDPNKAVVGFVTVSLLGQDSTQKRVVITGKDGAFTFSEVASGSYRLKLESPGIQPFTTDPFEVQAGVHRDIPIQVVRIAVQTTTVNVSASLVQVAEAQVKELEQQRILGILPDYYTSYIWNPAPMTTKLKFGMARRTLMDPISILVAGSIAGTEQWHKTFPGYGQGAEGYAKRFGSTYADTVVSRMFGSAIYPTLFHQDPRYFYLGKGSMRARFVHAVVSAFVCRGDDGQLEPNYSHILASFTAAGVSNLYKAPQDRQAGLTFRNGLIITASAAAVNLVREFISRPLTPNVPAFANGKP